MFTIEPIAHRRMWIGESWHDAVPVYSMGDVLPGHRRHPDRAPSHHEGVAR
jgi:hypothetical protein